jgi:hypothetical protein
VLALVSFGCVAENIVVRGARLGYRVDVVDTPDSSDPALVAAFHLTRVDPVDAPLERAIATRQTNRALRYRGPPLAPVELQAMAQLVRDLEGITLAFHDSGAARARLLWLIRIAETERFRTRPLHEELFSAVRFDVGWRSSADEGLPPGALGVEPPLRPAFAQLRHWPVMKALRAAGGHRALGRRAGWLPSILSPHLGVVYTRLPILQGAFAAGRALERIWLEATCRGLAFQPLAASPLLAVPEYGDVPAATGERLRQGWRTLSPGTPAMVFRMGRARPLPVRSSRPPAARFVKD